MEKKNSELKNIWLIRESRGLDHAEKVFLYTVESRGAMHTKWGKAAADMGMGKDLYYRARKGLLAKGVIKTQVRYDDTTVYVIDARALRSFVPNHSAETNNSAETNSTHSSETNEYSAETNEYSAETNDHSAETNKYSAEPETKRTMKITMKGTKKRTMKKNTDKPPVADAPAVFAQSQGEQGTHSPLGDTQDDSLPLEKCPVSLPLEKRQGGRVAGAPQPSPSNVSKETMRSLLEESKERAAREWEEGRKRLDDLLGDRDLTEDIKNQARLLFEDKEWRPDRKGAGRAAWAVFSAKPQPPHIKEEKNEAA